MGLRRVYRALWSLYPSVLFHAISYNERTNREAVLHIGQSIYYKAYWLLPTAALAGLAEVIGWSGRLWSAKNPTLIDPFLMQYVSLSTSDVSRSCR
jgi:hypothetical protein